MSIAAAERSNVLRLTIAISVLAVVGLTAISTRSERWTRPDARDRRFSRLVNTTNLTGTTSTAPPANNNAFIFADSTGTGMGTACACAAVTGVAGEAITFTRASNSYCSKSLDATGIGNSDLATCTTNQPRVKASTAGGTLMVGISLARTNTALRSQQFENAAWSKTGTTAAAPTVTANPATAPDGTVTADRVQFAATANSSNQASVLNQNTGCAGTRDSASVYVKGNGTSGNIMVCTDAAGSVLESECTQTAFNSTTWTRAFRNNQTGTARFEIGNITSAGGNAMAASDVFLWQADCQASTTSNPTVGEPIPTSAASVTAAAESATFAKPASMNDTAGCAGVSTFRQAGTTPVGETLALNTGNNMLDFSATTTSRILDATNTVTGTVTSTAGRLARQLGGWQTSDTSLKLFGEVSATGTYDGTIIGATLGIGGNAADTTGAVDALVGNVVLGTTQTNCL